MFLLYLQPERGAARCASPPGGPMVTPEYGAPQPVVLFHELTSTTPSTATDGIGFRSERGPVLGALMLTTGLVALDSTIIATAVPSIVQDVGGFTQFPWLFSIYLLTAAVTVPLYGKLADVIGRKPLLFFGIAVFLLGSVLCGVAWSMPALIAFRAVQGIGAGAIQPISMTVVGDLYSVAERARVQGYLASVWGVVLGRRARRSAASSRSTCPGGGSSSSTCRSAPSPPGCSLRHFSEKVTRRPHRLDYTGAALLTVGLLAGHPRPARGRRRVGLGLAAEPRASSRSAPCCCVAFVARGAARRRAGAAAVGLRAGARSPAGNLTAVAVGALTIGLSSYVPTYVQGVLGTGALVAGFALAALTVGWPLAATFSGRLYTPDRLSRHRADRGGVRPAWAPCCARCSGGPRPCGRSPARASWSGSAWASCPAPSSSRCSRSSAGTGAAS